MSTLKSCNKPLPTEHSNQRINAERLQDSCLDGKHTRAVKYFFLILNICRIQNKNPHSNTETMLLTVRFVSGIRDVMMMMNLKAFVVLSS